MPSRVRRAWFSQVVLWAAVLALVFPAMAAPARAFLRCTCPPAAAVASAREDGGRAAAPAAKAHPRCCRAPCCGPRLAAPAEQPDPGHRHRAAPAPSVDPVALPEPAVAAPTAVAVPDGALARRPPRASPPAAVPRVLRC